MGQRRGKKHTPRKYDVEKPDNESWDSPDNRHTHQEAILEKQADSEKKVADVAHPEHVAEFIDAPVMNALCEKEDERQDAKKTD
jgi:hypothetical protein